MHFAGVVCRDLMVAGCWAVLPTLSCSFELAAWVCGLGRLCESSRPAILGSQVVMFQGLRFQTSPPCGSGLNNSCLGSTPCTQRIKSRHVFARISRKIMR